MPRIHIIFDPRDRVQMPKDDWIKSAGAHVAVMPVIPQATKEELHDLAVKLVTLLLENVDL